MKRSLGYLTFIVLLCSAALAQAQGIVFTSSPPTTGIVNTKYLYNADVAAKDSAGIEYTLVYGPSSMDVDKATGWISWTPSDTGTYSVQIRAGLKSNPSAYVIQSWDIVVHPSKDEEKVQIIFTSKPAITGTVGQSYSFDADASASNSGALTYSIISGPSSMSINSQSGLVSWTPASVGIYTVSIRATLASDTSIYTTMTWNITVSASGGGNPAPFSIISTPSSQTLDGKPVTYTIGLNVTKGFTASVYLKASAPTLPYATLTLNPTTINYPYTAKSVLTVTVTGPKIPGTHNIIIEGSNGAVVARDTVTLTVTAKSAWQVFNTDNSPMTTNTIRALVVDHNGVGWIALPGELAHGASNDPSPATLLSFDGTSWTVFDTSSTYPFAGSSPGDRELQALAVDSSNVLWVLSKSALASYDGTEWKTYQLPGRVHWEGSQMKLAIDHAGNVWIAGNEEGLIKFDGSGFVTYPLGETNTVAVDSEGNVWTTDVVGKWAASYDGSFWTTYDEDEGTLPVRAIGRSFAMNPQDGSINLITSSERILKFHQGIISITGGTGAGPVQYPGPEPNYMVFDNSGTTWVGNGEWQYSYGASKQGGLIRYDGKDFWYYQVDNSGLPDRDISALFAASNGTIWIGTQRGGLAILDGTAPAASLFSEPLGVRQESTVLSQQHLTGIWPNPAQNRAIISLDITTRSHARLSVVNALGEEIAVALDGDIDAGHRQVQVDLEHLTAGTYFLRLDIGGMVEAQPLVVTR